MTRIDGVYASDKKNDVLTIYYEPDFDSQDSAIKAKKAHELTKKTLSDFYRSFGKGHIADVSDNLKRKGRNYSSEGIIFGKGRTPLIYIKFFYYFNEKKRYKDKGMGKEGSTHIRCWIEFNTKSYPALEQKAKTALIEANRAVNHKTMADMILYLREESSRKARDLFFVYLTQNKNIYYN